MSHEARRQFIDVVAELGMTICPTSMVRRSLIDPRTADDLATHRGIDAAAEVGSSILCLGLHGPLLPQQTAIPWFWTVPADHGVNHLQSVITNRLKRIQYRTDLLDGFLAHAGIGCGRLKGRPRLVTLVRHRGIPR
jgi:hypothetical protein